MLNMGATVSQQELTEREIKIAKLAADLAVKQITETFYQDVGRTVVNKFFIIVGAMAVAFAAGKWGFDITKWLGK